MRLYPHDSLQLSLVMALSSSSSSPLCFKSTLFFRQLQTVDTDFERNLQQALLLSKLEANQAQTLKVLVSAGFCACFRPPSLSIIVLIPSPTFSMPLRLSPMLMFLQSLPQRQRQSPKRRRRKTSTLSQNSRKPSLLPRSSTKLPTPT